MNVEPETRMNVALTTWNGRISPVCDVARHVQIVMVQGGRVMGRREEELPGTDLAAQVECLVALGTQVLICGALSRPLAEWLGHKGIQVVGFIGGTVDQVLDAWLADRLPDPALMLPGCRCRMRRRRGRPGNCNKERIGS